MPFANMRQALERTPSRGFAEPQLDGTYVAQFSLPNAYYAGLGARLVPPSLHVAYRTSEPERKVRGRVQVSEPVPFRNGAPQLRQALAARDGGAAFYAAGPRASEVRSQERVLRDSEYPVARHGDYVRLPSPRDAQQFWGARPPV
jgi:hypothetical protein